MRKFRDIPIKQKLVIAIMLTTAAALLLTGTGVVVADAVLVRRDLQNSLVALVEIIADNSTAALAFDDPRSARETLGALRARSHLLKACIYRPDGAVFAEYSREGTVSACTMVRAAEEVRFGGGGVTVSHPIVLNGRQIGTLSLFSDLGEISERMNLDSALLLGVLLVSSLIAFLISERLGAVIAMPISQLVGATTSVTETGDYGIRVQKVSGDELGLLGDRFNEMLAGIQSRDDSLNKALRDREDALRDAEKARERFRFMAESMPQKIFTATPDGEIEYLNRQWVEFTGLPVEQITQRGWSQIVHPEDYEPNSRIWRHSLATGEPMVFQSRFRRADGEYRWHLTRVLAMRDAAGKISMWIGSNTEIHEQKEKEEDLRRANEDLQQFAYSASHDLQEPIRNVAVYSEIVAKRYHSVLDADGRQFLGFMTEGGRRLATLINDLLAYTRAGVVETAATDAPSSDVLQRVLSSLAEAIRESGATISYDALPHVHMAETHLQQVFQNLISNALKYRKEEPPRIHISATQQGAAVRFSVQDNGIGIEPQYKEKIFGVFKRLHHDQKYSGTGIGLAICQRVVERYGGRIWVESSPGEGANFFFTVPEYIASGRAAAADTSTGRR
jgi:PAS domain S-box-containing protein